MRLHVAAESGVLGESLAADLTDVALVGCMDFLVLAQILGAGERFVADITFFVSYIQMTLDVIFEQ